MITIDHVMIGTTDEEETGTEAETLTIGEAMIDDDQSHTTMMIANAVAGRCTWAEIHGKRVEGEFFPFSPKKTNSN